MAERRRFGDCVGCGQPILPPYRSFVVQMNHAPTGYEQSEWEAADVCDSCAAKLTVDEFYRVATAEDEEEVAA